MPKPKKQNSSQASGPDVLCPTCGERMALVTRWNGNVMKKANFVCPHEHTFTVEQLMGSAAA